MGIPYGWLALFNLGYEVSDACTSIVAQTPDGKILHARNLDFWAGMGFTETLKEMTVQIDFQKGGKTLFTSTSFVGMVGLLSGFKPHAFSATVDTRFYPGGIGELFYEIIAAIEERNASLVSFLLRDVFTNEQDFQGALENLSNDELIADVYYILAGVSAGQGAVISRNRTGADDVWLLDSPSRWFEVETNYDHWKEAPWFDDRIDPANAVMNSFGQQAISLDNMWKTLSTKPVFNLQTTYSILSCPATGEYSSFTRYCPYPCVE
uniref:ceramidase n=1 Tax=Arcella intermedia TaxID=1963864 RepID=A0A6B2LA01_9EUKA